MKRVCAALLAACLLALSACGKTEIVAREQALQSQRESDTSAPLNWDAAYAAYAPEAVMFTVGSEAVTWQEFFYQFTAAARALEKSSGLSITDWDMTVTDENGGSVACGDYVLQAAVQQLTLYHVIHERLHALGLALSDEGRARVEAYRQTTITEQFAGDAAAFAASLEELYGSEEIWRWLCEVDELYNEGFDFLCGVEGSALSDGEAIAYGEEYGYVGLREIYIYNNAAANSAEPSSDDPMSLMLAALAEHKEESAALVECFAALAAQYNENLSLENYPEGRCVWEGDVDAAVYSAALAMQDYEYAIVSLEDADVLLLRVPLAADAAVLYDAENDALRSLRYYAAWQAYNEQIHGEGGWLASAVCQSVSPFETFSPKDVF